MSASSSTSSLISEVWYDSQSQNKLSRPPGHNPSNSNMAKVTTSQEDEKEEMQPTSPTFIRELATCQCQSPHRRNLVVCIDGTANQFSHNNSNVVELYSRLVKSKDQLTYYNSGIGTYVKDSNAWFSLDGWRQSLNHAVDMAVATSFKNKVLGAYQWLSENYEDGDHIFLFGFSRGAYQVRVIAGMIEKVGLLHKGNNEQIPFAYELYTKTNENEKRLLAQQPDSLCKRFKHTLSRPNVRVHFVGAWDTVSSIGVMKGRSLPETTRGMKHVCTFRQALALDELRVKFLPEYVNGGEGPRAGDSAERIKEVWFAGSHSDIGGGNTPNLGLDRFGPSLRWMSYEAIRYGLKMEPNRSQWSLIKSTPSMTPLWRFLEYMPVSRLSYRDADSVNRWPPHCEGPREMKARQLIHESVFEEMNLKEGYRPKARTHDGTEWDKAKMQMLGMVESDVYTVADHVISRLDDYKVVDRLGEQDIHALDSLASTEIGRRSITEFPRSADLLIAALLAEIEDSEEQGTLKAGAADANGLESIILVLVKALDAFKVTPSYDLNHESSSLRKLWHVLEKKYPGRKKIWHKFKTIFCYSRPQLVLAFDVGTTFSSISYSILGPREAPEICRVTRFPAQTNSSGDAKIPSIIYYDKEGNVRAAGAEATRKGIEKRAEHEGWLKAEWFKLHLTRSTAQIKIPALPKGKTVIDVFADFLRYLHECVRTYIEETHPNGVHLWKNLSSRTEFVLTHPNDWESSQQSSMRTAAVIAGLVPDSQAGQARLSFLTEGEASLHYCMQKGLTNQEMNSGTGVFIVDAGGCTIDISTYKQPTQQTISYEEIAPPECHFQGSAFVTKNAEAYFENLLMNSRFHDKIARITKRFDKTTKLTFHDAEEPQYIKFGSRDKDPKLNIRSGQLKLNGSEVATFFEPSIQCIIKSIDEQCGTSKTPIESAFLVGGFAANDWLFSQLKNACSSRSLSLSRPAGHVNKAVADGAISLVIDRFVAGLPARLT